MKRNKNKKETKKRPSKIYAEINLKNAKAITYINENREFKQEREIHQKANHSRKKRPALSTRNIDRIVFWYIIY